MSVNNVRWIVFGVIVVALIGGIAIYSQVVNPSLNVSKVDTNKIIAASKDNGEIADHVLGSTAQQVTLIEYGDYECPYCGEVYAPLKSITTEYGDKITFIFRNFPLTTIHPNARAAAAAAEAAGLQGKYWDMHDALYTNQSDWENLTGDQRTSAFQAYAQSIGLDMTKFNAALDNGAVQVNKKIAFDQALGTKLNINATPSIYLDGTLMDTTITSDLQQGSGTKLKALLNADLKKAGITLPDPEQ